MREDSLDFDKLGIHLDKTDIRILKLLANDSRISYAEIAQGKIASSAISMTISAEKRSGYASAFRRLDSLFSGWVFGKAVPIARPYSLPGSKTVQTVSI